jgi:hypothetical protein
MCLLRTPKVQNGHVVAAVVPFAFLEAVTARLPTSRDAIGLGSLHRIAAETPSKTRIAVARDEEKSIWPVVSFGPSRVHKPTCFTADPRIAVDCGRSDQMNARDPARTAMCTAVDIECDFPAPWPPRNNQPPIKGARTVTCALAGRCGHSLCPFSRPTAVLQQ